MQRLQMGPRHTLAAVTVLFASCTAIVEPPKMATGRDLPAADGPPQITYIRDLSLSHLPNANALDNPGDGVGVIGELLRITGENFGRGPRITIDGRPAAIEGRASDGSIVARVPWGARSGQREIAVVTADAKRAARKYTIGRYVLATVPSRDELVTLRLLQDGMLQRIKRPLTIPNAHLVRFSSAGDVALVSSADDNDTLELHAIDMVHAKHPRLLSRYTIPGKQVIAIAAALRAPSAAVVTDTHMLFATLEPGRPIELTQPIELPKPIVGRVIAADLSPNGDRLAILLRQNELHLYDVTDPKMLTLLATAKVLPQERTPLVRAIEYGVNSKTIWVLSGNNAQSSRRRYPLRLTLIRIHEQTEGRAQSFGVLSIWRSMDIPYHAAPVDIAVARGQPTPSGGTVAVPPENAAVFISAHDSKLLRLRNTRFDRAGGLRHAVRILQKISPHVGTLVRCDSAGQGGPLFTSSSLLGPIDITSDSQLLLVAGTRVKVQRKPNALKLVYGIITSHVWGASNRRFVALAEVDPETLPRPFLMGDVQVQP